MNISLKLLAVFAISFAALIVIDIIWIGGVAKSLYQTKLAQFLDLRNGSLSIRILPAIILYAFMTAGALYFVVLPRVDSSALDVIRAGLFYGLVIYSVYDLTNYSIMPAWPLSITIIDLIWGTVLNGIVSYVGWFTYRLF